MFEDRQSSSFRIFCIHRVISAGLTGIMISARKYFYIPDHTCCEGDGHVQKTS